MHIRLPRFARPLLGAVAGAAAALVAYQAFALVSPSLQALLAPPGDGAALHAALSPQESRDREARLNRIVSLAQRKIAARLDEESAAPKSPSAQ